MARQGKGIFDSFKGNIGEIQGAKNNGKGIIKSKPIKTTRTQTEGLIKTKTNYEIALRIYEEMIIMKWGPLFGPTKEKMTTKQYFLSKILILLNSNEVINKHIQLFPNSINYDRMKGILDQTVSPDFMRIYYNLEPMSSAALPSDVRLSIRYHTESDQIIINERFEWLDRKDGVRTWSWNQATKKGERRINIFLFVSKDWKRIFTGHTVSFSGI